jgi:hypothetical protein
LGLCGIGGRMKIYLINWGFYSSNDGGHEMTAIYSTYEKALKHIQIETHNFEDLKQKKNKKTGKLTDCWTDGDYWVSIDMGYMDSPILYMSNEEYENMWKEE